MPTAIHPDTHLGAIRLTVADLDTTARFYETVVGLKRLDRDGEAISLGAGETAVVELSHDPDAPPRPRRTTGLFHHAILVPDRLELERCLGRILASGWPLGGASDHLVSEALYIRDPEGNGIEIYRDRPRDDWRRRGDELEMDTLPLDLEGLLREAQGTPSGNEGIAPGTRLGHVHLNVADLAETEDFYAGRLGFEVTVRSYPGALFFAAGGYHHHLGANTWAGEGAPAPPPGARGLRWFEIVVPEWDGDPKLTDPSGNGIVMKADD
jgi:catechol 2,3-dioxygenase